jgi:anti-sigma B factor antagonist
MLKVHVKNLGNSTILCLQGQIINGETDVLRSLVEGVSGVNAVILDFAGVYTIDAHGLGVLLELRQETAAKGVHFELLNLSQQVRRVFEITRLDSIFEISFGIEVFPWLSNERRAALAALKSCA